MKIKDTDGDITVVEVSGDSVSVQVDFEGDVIEMLYPLEQAQQLITALQNAVIELQFGGEKDGR